MTMKYEVRWKKDKLLGTGGQAEVHLAREIGNDDELVKSLFDHLQDALTNVSYKNQREVGQAGFADVLPRLVESRRNHRNGALKLLHRDESSRPIASRTACRPRDRFDELD